jgi:pimeloyl-ACP methyl ester carboxylesterase
LGIPLEESLPRTWLFVFPTGVNGLVLVEVPIGKELGSVKFPVLMIFGEQDSDMGGLSRLQVATAQLEDIHSANLQFIENAGHSPMLENPSKFYEVLCDFSEELAHN